MAPKLAASKRRSRGRWAFLILIPLLAGPAIVGWVAGRNERIKQFWAVAEVHPERSADIAEKIEYYFSESRHGIYRDVPGLDPSAVIEVSSEDAPDQFVVQRLSLNDTRIQIGNPSKTIIGTHHYDIDYPLERVMTSSDRLLWNGVGQGWQVPIEHAHLEVVAPWSWDQVGCVRSNRKSGDGCTVTQPEPGRLVVTADDLDAHEFVQVQGRRGASLATTPSPGAFTPPPPSKRLASPLLLIGGLLVVGFAAAVGVSRLLRRAGRDLVGGDGSATGAAFAADVAPGASVLALDDRELASMSTIDFAPPSGVEPWQGGLVLDERVTAAQKVGWLLGTTLDGAVDLVEHDGTTTLTRKAVSSSPADTLLAVGFASRSSITLGTYDSSFAAMWKMLDPTFTAWANASNLWDGDADRRKARTQVVGFLGVVVGALVIGLLAFAASRSDAAFAPFALVGGVLAGAGLATLVRGWELRRRTPVGTALRLRVEAFRRFLAESEASHVEEAATRGVLRQYTAWAVALGEADHWSKVCAQATNVPEDAGLHTAMLAPTIMHSMSSTSVAPSSSGSGGGGGGGGGFGGGGGGSW